MLVKNRLESKNAQGQKMVIGYIKLTKPCEMLNRANDGKTPWNPKYRKPSSLVVPAGTEVEYSSSETCIGKFHTVSYRKDGQVWYRTEKTDDANYGN